MSQEEQQLLMIILIGVSCLAVCIYTIALTLRYSYLEYKRYKRLKASQQETETALLLTEVTQPEPKWEITEYD